MLACVDVSYGSGNAVAGCLLFSDWWSSEAAAQRVATTPVAAPYRAGEFYRRELPALLAVLALVDTRLDAVVVDGYVWLGGARPGLGAHLHAAVGERFAIIGVGKTAWGGQPDDPADDSRRTVPVLRGKSLKPLFVTAAGMDVAAAATLIAQMHGRHRIPTLLKAVDRLVRN